MAMPAALDRYYTREEVLAFPDDGNRYELVYGELLVSPAPVPRHQRIIGRLYVLLTPYVKAHGLGEVLMSPADITWGRPDDVLVQPDLFVVGPEDAGRASWNEFRHFHLFVEAASLSTARYDRFTKRTLYQHQRVPLYWMLDGHRNRAEVWTPDATAPVFEERMLRWHPEGAEAPFVVQLAELFAP